MAGLALWSWLWLGLGVPAVSGKGPPAWECRPGEPGRSPDQVSLIHVDYALGRVGLVRTPRFPDRFPLPLRCVWVFNNTAERRRNPDWRLNFYLTQFYISPEYFSAAGLNATADLDLTEAAGWKAIDALGTQFSGFDWHLYKKLWFSNDDYYLLKLNIEATAFDYLHRRVLEVNDVYGFNITFEANRGASFANSCSLLECNLNGECFSEVDPGRPDTLSGFHCGCSVPRFSPTKIDEPFMGKRCQFHNKNKECTFTDRGTCQNGGTCRYFTSRYVVCDCPSGWSGSTCEIPVDTKKRFKSATENQCEQIFYKNEFPTPIANEIMLKAFAKESSKLYKIDSSKNGTSTIFYEFHGNATSIAVDAFSGLSENNHSLMKTTMCVQETLLLTVERHNASLVVRDEEFSLTCVARGFKNPKFVWKKDVFFRIDPLMSITTQRPIYPSNFVYVARHFERRHITIWPVEPGSTSDEFQNAITIAPANSYDSGLFSCTVYETLSENFSLSNMESLPSQTASLRINVLTKPRIEVYPKSLTIIQQCKNVNGSPELCQKVTEHNTLHCFVLSNVDNGTALNYNFFWQKNGQNVSDLSHRFEHEDEMWEPLGKTLTIGELHNRTNFTCVAYDRRYPEIISSETIIVSVAKTIDETCRTTTIAQQLWPFTLMGEDAYVKCTKALGYSSHRCDRGHGALKWTEQIDNSDCLRESLIGWQRRIERFLSGYSEDSSDEQILFNFTSNFEDIVNSKALTRKEQQVVFAVLSKMFWAMYSKPFNLNYSAMSDIFYLKCLPHLMLLPNPNIESLLETFDLIRTSALVFGSRLTRTDRSMRNQKMFSWEEPYTTGCFHDMKVAVKLVQITNSPKNSYKKIWPTAQQTLAKENYIPQAKEALPNSTICFGSFRVSFDLTAPSESFFYDAMPVVSIVFFKDLEDHLKTNSSTGDNSRSASLNFERNSSLATIVYAHKINYYPMPKLNISIRFLDSVFKNPNESSKFNLTCASINWLSQEGAGTWKVPDEDCEILWHPEGMMCRCTKPGTFGLVKTWRIQERTDSKLAPTSSVVILSCGISLTLMALSGIFLIVEIRKWPSMTTLLILKIILVNLIIIMLVTLSVTTMLDEHTSVSLSTCLQYFILLSQCLLIGLIANVYTKATCVSHRSYSKFFLGAAVLFPFAYVALPIKYELGSSNMPKVWFIKTSTPMFPIFIGVTSFLFASFGILFSIVMKKLPSSHINYTKRKKLLIVAACHIATLYFFVIALVVYVNGILILGKEFLLAASCLLLGVVTSALFVAKRQFKFSSPNESIILNLSKDQGNCFVGFRSKVGKSVCSKKRCTETDSNDGIVANRYFVQRQKNDRFRLSSQNSDTSVLMSNIFVDEDCPIRAFSEIQVLRTDPVSGDRTVDEVLKLSDISDLSPEPLYEVLKIVQACEEFPLRSSADCPRNGGAVRQPSTCSSASAATRSRRNTDSGNETQSVSIASDYKVKAWKPTSTQNNSGVYVTMKPQTNDQVQGNVCTMNQEKSSLPLRVELKQRTAKSKFSAEEDETTDDESNFKTHRSNRSLEGQSHRGRRRKPRRNLPTSFSVPLMTKDGNFQNFF